MVRAKPEEGARGRKLDVHLGHCSGAAPESCDWPVSLPLPWGCFRCDRVQGWREIWDPFCAFCGSAADDDDVVATGEGEVSAASLIELATQEEEAFRLTRVASCCSLVYA